MTVRELLARTDARELNEWREFLTLEPPGADDEWRMGRLAQVIQSSAGVRGKKPQDYMRDYFTERTQDAEGQLALFDAIAGSDDG